MLATPTLSLLWVGEGVGSAGLATHPTRLPPLPLLSSQRCLYLPCTRSSAHRFFHPSEKRLRQRKEHLWINEQSLIARVRGGPRGTLLVAALPRTAGEVSRGEGEPGWTATVCVCVCVICDLWCGEWSVQGRCGVDVYVQSGGCGCGVRVHVGEPVRGRDGGITGAG